MQNTNELIEATQDHKEAIDAATDALKKATASGPEAQPGEARVQRFALYTVDVPWPAGKEMRELEVEVKAPGECLGAFFAILPPNPLLVTPGEKPSVIPIVRIVFNASPDAETVKRHIIAQPVGSAMGMPEGMPDELRPAFIGLVHNPMSGNVVALWLEPPDPAEPTEIPYFVAKPPAQEPEQATEPAQPTES